MLDLLDIEGCIITIDAIGTQTKIAEKIIENNADNILSVKGNQKELFEQVESRFKHQKPATVNETVEEGHGRLETRQCEVITNLIYLDNSEKWTGISSIIKITSTRETVKKKETETRYYISTVV